jgi:hypothetical protein
MAMLDYQMVMEFHQNFKWIDKIKWGSDGISEGNFQSCDEAFSEASSVFWLGRLDLEKCMKMCVFLKLDVILFKTGSDHINPYHFICDNYWWFCNLLFSFDLIPWFLWLLIVDMPCHEHHELCSESQDQLVAPFGKYVQRSKFFKSPIYHPKSGYDVLLNPVGRSNPAEGFRASVIAASKIRVVSSRSPLSIAW